MMSKKNTHLRIAWQAHGGRGFGSWHPKDDEHHLRLWAAQLQNAHRGALFEIVGGTPTQRELEQRVFPV